MRVTFNLGHWPIIFFCLRLICSTDAIERFKKETLRVYGVLEIRLSGKYTGESRDYLAGSGKGKYSVSDIGECSGISGKFLALSNLPKVPGPGSRGGKGHSQKRR